MGMGSGVGALIDDFRDPERAANGARWRFASDTVMGGVSAGVLAHRRMGGRPALRMTGDVSLENDGGFISMSVELAPDGGTFDASQFAGVRFDVLGNGDLDKAYTVKVQAFSKSAIAKIEAAGGKAEVV